MSQVEKSEATYAEVHSVVKETFHMEKNKCYADVKVTPQKASPASGGNKTTIIALVVTIVLVVMLILAVAACCIAFAITIAFIHQQVNDLQIQTQQLADSLGRLAQYPAIPVPSCAALPPSSPSGYYWVRASNGSAVRVYCDMIRSCGGVTGGWMRVAELDMTNSSHQCPSGLRQRTDSNMRICVSASSSFCSSDIYTVSIGYTRVCGRIIGYQIGHTNAFSTALSSINSEYVDGVSLTHGSPRQHIWTFAAARGESDVNPFSNCPCNSGFDPTNRPAFVKNL